VVLVGNIVSKVKVIDNYAKLLIDDCCRLRELHTLKGHVESVVKLKGLDIETIQQSYTV
jgi:hypothetical protein